MTKKQRKTIKKGKKLTGKPLPRVKTLTRVLEPPDPC